MFKYFHNLDCFREQYIWETFVFKTQSQNKIFGILFQDILGKLSCLHLFFFFLIPPSFGCSVRSPVRIYRWWIYSLCLQIPCMLSAINFIEKVVYKHLTFSLVSQFIQLFSHHLWSGKKILTLSTQTNSESSGFKHGQSGFKFNLLMISIQDKLCNFGAPLQNDSARPLVPNY